jgi:hypothetical protein
VAEIRAAVRAGGVDLILLVPLVGGAFRVV